MYLVQDSVDELQALDGLFVFEPELFLCRPDRQDFGKPVADPGSVVIMAFKGFVQLAQVIKYCRENFGERFIPVGQRLPRLIVQRFDLSNQQAVRHLSN